ncbi:molybdenum cofactor guanylyltransferase [Paenibacillus thailandensis]|uniref:Probable molybdenum cofactor guanylyltransferase n=1 Tax=Paenibacillus thailandensis TaxID=393250 RepID=A0ABW5R249_9BACL
MERTEVRIAGAGYGLEGLILAGGQARRMAGTAKGSLLVGGVPIAETIASQMRRACGTVAIAVADIKQAAPYAGLNAEFYIDPQPDCGPLGALHAALERSKLGLVWVSACDMPFASAKAASVMAEALRASDAQAAVPLVGGRLHPLQAVYRADCAEAAGSCLAAGDYRMHALLERVRVIRVTEEQFAREGVDCRFVTNINTPEDYRRLFA